MPALGNRRLAGLQPLGSSPGGFFNHGSMIGA
jgi:hypothetical protein